MIEPKNIFKEKNCKICSISSINLHKDTKGKVFLYAFHRYKRGERCPFNFQQRLSLKIGLGDEREL